MRTKKIVVAVLVALGFGGAVGLGGCARRAQKSGAADGTARSPDTIRVVGWDKLRGEPDVRVMYGTPRRRFDPSKPLRKLGPGVVGSPNEGATPASASGDGSTAPATKPATAK